MTTQADVLSQLADRTRRRSQEVFDVVYIQPHGTGRAIIRPPGCLETTVATSFSTYRPGTTVTAIRNQLGDYIIQDPPRAGAGAFPPQQVAQQLEQPVVVIDPLTDVAFLVFRRRLSPSGWWAHYADETGAYHSVYGPVPVLPYFTTRPLSKDVSRAGLAVGSLSTGWKIAKDNETDFWVVDFLDGSGGTEYTRTAPSGRGMSWPVLRGLKLVWLEYLIADTCPTPGDGTLWLMESDPDLTSVVEFASGTISRPGPPAACSWGSVISRSADANDNVLALAISFVDTAVGTGHVRVGFEDLDTSPVYIGSTASLWTPSTQEQGIAFSATHGIQDNSGVLETVNLNTAIDNAYTSLITQGVGRTLVDWHMSVDRSTIYAGTVGAGGGGTDDRAELYDSAGTPVKTVTIAHPPAPLPPSSPMVGILAISPSDLP